MPLPMPKGTRSNLIEQLTKSIYESIVFPNGRVVPSSMRMTATQAQISTGCDLDKAASAILGEQHITTFVRSEMQCIQLDRSKLSALSSRFRDCYSVDEAEFLASGLIRSFESLPWNYHFLMALPGLSDRVQQMDQGLIKISPTTQLVAGWCLNSEEGSAACKRTPNRNSPSQSRWHSHSIYAKISVDGYVSSDHKSESVLQVHDRLFSLIGLLVAFKILEADYLWANGDEGRNPISVILESDQIEQQLDSIHLDSTYQTLANDLGYTSSFLSLTEPPDASAEALERLIEALQPCTSDRISSAAKWFLDSHAGNNAQVKFVQLMIAFEILLGDRAMSKETGIATLMANRCAYMIGRSSKHRENLIAAFKHGYEIRNRIVHAGTSRLTHKEQINFQFMQELCAKVIQHEADALFDPA